jgi:hypothetical protein
MVGGATQWRRQCLPDELEKDLEANAAKRNVSKIFGSKYVLFNDLQDMSDQSISWGGGWRSAEGWKDGIRKRALYVEIRYT